MSDRTALPAAYQPRPATSRSATSIGATSSVPAAFGLTLLSPQQLLQLQRSAGNRAVIGLAERRLTVQRCGGEPCGCPAEEQITATQPTPSVQRVHLDSSGRNLFDCDDFTSEPKLVACLNDETRLGPPQTGPAVAKVQNALLKDGMDLGPKGADGIFGGATVAAVRAFKLKHSLGSEQFGDVGPGTMTELDAECTGRQNPPPPPPLPDDLIMRVAKSERDGALRVAGNKLRELADLLDSGTGVPVQGNSTVTAVSKWLLVPPTAGNFAKTVRRALAIIDGNSLVQTSITIDRTQTTDFAHVGAIGEPASGIVLEDPFFKSNVRCMREVMAHEFFHLSGLVHAYDTTDPEEAINCPHHLAELVFDLATTETGGCTRPPVDDLTPAP